MTEHVYQASVVWAILGTCADFTNFFGPWLVLIGTVVWAFRRRSWQSYLGALSGFLVAGAHLAHLTVAEVHTVALGGQQPAVGENAVVVFFYIYGLTFGYALLGIALVSQYLRKQIVA